MVKLFLQRQTNSSRAYKEHSEEEAALRKMKKNEPKKNEGTSHHQ